MSYQVLARRLRPKDFDGLVGQDHVVRALRNGLDSGRVHHAYLFTGTRGVGKTTIARILAKSLNCEAGVSSSPCGACSICREVEENRFIDLVEVDAASRTRVDDTRELLDNAQYLPSRGRYKVYLIDEVHMLSASSFNAFLKTLEEPPEHVKFLLATTDPKKVPVTVLSRCLQFQLKNIGRDEIARYIGEVLAAEEVKFEPEAVRIIAKSARGSMRDALSITDQAIAYSQGALAATDVAAMVGAAGRDETGAVMEALASGDPGRVLALSAALADKSVDFGSVLAELLEALHGMAVGQALGETAEGGLSPEAVQLYYQIALLGYRDLHIGPDPKTGFEMTLLRMLAFAPDAASAARVPAAVAEQPKSGRTVPAVPPSGSVPVPGEREVNKPAPAQTAQPGNTQTAFAPDAASAARVPAAVAKQPKSGRTVPAAPPSGSVPMPGEREVNKPAPVQTAQPENTQTAFAPDAASAARVPAAVAEQPKSGRTVPAVPPSGSAPVPGEPEVNKPAPAQTAQPENTQAAPEPESIPPTNGEAAVIDSAAATDLCREWYELVGRLNLKGIDRMIAEHSLLVERGANHCRLVLDRRHESLLNGGDGQGLERALAGLLGEPIRVVIDIGEPARETPAGRKARLADERQAAARRQLEENPTVQLLIRTFDGRLEDVRPLGTGGLKEPGVGV